MVFKETLKSKLIEIIFFLISLFQMPFTGCEMTRLALSFYDANYEAKIKTGLTCDCHILKYVTLVLRIRSLTLR